MHQPLLSDLFLGMLEFAKKKHVILYTPEMDIECILTAYDEERVYFQFDDGLGCWRLADVVGMTVVVEKGPVEVVSDE